MAGLGSRYVLRVCHGCDAKFQGYGLNAKWCPGCRRRRENEKHRRAYARNDGRGYMRDYQRRRLGIPFHQFGCVWCAGDVWGRGRKFCSPQCRSDHQRFLALLKRLEIHESECRVCGVVFESVGYKPGWYCSPGCSNRGKACLRKGMQPERFREILAIQQGCCAVCKRELTSSKMTHIDHCHRTNVPRGILCHNCNLAIGQAQDDPGRLRALAAYLEQPSLLVAA